MKIHLKITFLLIAFIANKIVSEDVNIITQEFRELPILVEDGSKIRISCSHDKVSEVYNYTWKTPLRDFGDTKEINNVDGMSIWLKEKKNTFEYILEIESFSEDYAGEYGCWPIPRYEPIELSTVILKRKVLENITIFEDEFIVLPCFNDYRHLFVLQSDWYRNGIVVSRRKNPKRMFDFGIRSLILKNTKTNDSGLYECKVFTPNGHLTISIYQVTVIKHEDPSRINLKPKRSPENYSHIQSNKIYEGLEVKLHCSCISCWPLTSFKWVTPFGNFSQSEDKHLPKDFSIKTTFSVRDFAFDLVIKAAKKSHEGNYTCFLENTLGTFNRNISVKLLPDKIDVGKAVAFEGYRVKFRCNNEHLYKDPIWEKSDRFVKTHNISNYIVYHIFPVRISDSGQYLCEYRSYENVGYAMPYLRKVSACYNLRVLALTEEFTMLVNRVKEDDKINLICGNEDNINRVWTHNSYPILKPSICPHTKALTFIPIDNKTLIVEGKFSNNGVYRCNYTNSKGVMQKKKFLVLVEPRKPPKLQPDIQTYNIANVTTINTEEMSTITIQRHKLLCEDYITVGCKCWKNCEPLLRYNWTVPDSCSIIELSENLINDLNYDDGFIYSLKIPIDSTCSGLFGCRIENSKGSTSYNFKIIINHENSTINRDNTCCPNKLKNKNWHSSNDEFCGGF